MLPGNLHLVTAAALHKPGDCYQQGAEATGHVNMQAAAEKEAVDFQIAQRLQEQKAAEEAGEKDAEIARRLHDMQLAEAAASPPTLLPSPAASPEDLAAIAALEAGQDTVLQPPRPPTPPCESLPNCWCEARKPVPVNVVGPRVCTALVSAVILPSSLEFMVILQ